MTSRTLNYLLSILAFVLILINLLIILETPPASGYEISIYNAYNPLVWIFFILTATTGFILLIGRVYEKKNKWWIMGFFILLYNNILILLLPYIRGYYTYGRGDVLTHIGYTKDIIISGIFNSPGIYNNNAYPVMHILTTNLCYLTGLKPELIFQILPISFIIVYMVSIYLLARLIAPEHDKTIFVLGFASILLFKHENLMMAPSVIAFFILPCILLIYYKTRIPSPNNKFYAILLVLILLILPFIHPGEGTLFLIIIFSAINFAPWIYGKISRSATTEVITFRSGINISLILLVLWFFWISSFSTFGQQIIQILGWLFHEVGTTTANQYLTALSKANLSFFDFVTLLIKLNGQYIIYFSISLILIFAIVKKLYKKKKIDLEEFRYALLFIIFIILTLVSFIGIFGVEYNRVLRYAVFSATILNGIGLYSLTCNSSRKKLFKIAIISVLIVSSSVALFNVFPSPITKNYNPQVTAMEVEGMAWLLDNGNSTMPVETIDMGSAKRFEDLIKGLNYQETQGIYLKQTPEHFNYTSNNGYGDSFNKSDFYYLNFKLFEIYFPEVLPEYQDQWKFLPSDFVKLKNQDITVNIIYTNGEFWIGSVT